MFSGSNLTTRSGYLVSWLRLVPVPLDESTSCAYLTIIIIIIIYQTIYLTPKSHCVPPNHHNYSPPMQVTSA